MPRRGLKKMPSAQFLWEHSHLSYTEMALKLGASYGTVATTASKLRFRRLKRATAGFIAGPCSECGVGFKLDELDTNHVCAACRVGLGGVFPMFTPSEPIGRAPARTLTDPALLDDYEHELALRLERKGLALAYTYPERVRIIVHPNGKRDQGLFGFERRVLDVEVVTNAYRQQTAKLALAEVA